MEVCLDTSTVVVTGDVPIDSVLSAIETTGRVAALVGTGSALDAALRRAVPPEVGPPEENTVAVAEFKGHAYGHGAVHGVLRLVQLTGAHVGVRHGRVWVEEVSDTSWSVLISLVDRVVGACGLIVEWLAAKNTVLHGCTHEWEHESRD